MPINSQRRALVRLKVVASHWLVFAVGIVHVVDTVVLDVSTSQAASIRAIVVTISGSLGEAYCRVFEPQDGEWRPFRYVGERDTFWRQE